MFCVDIVLSCFVSLLIYLSLLRGQTEILIVVVVVKEGGHCSNPAFCKQKGNMCNYRLNNRFKVVFFFFYTEELRVSFRFLFDVAKTSQCKL